MDQPQFVMLYFLSFLIKKYQSKQRSTTQKKNTQTEILTAAIFNLCGRSAIMKKSLK